METQQRAEPTLVNESEHEKRRDENDNVQQKQKRLPRNNAQSFATSADET